jgi:hypothetical protein
MNKIVRNILAVLAGLFVGGKVNMILIENSSAIIPSPSGVNVTTVEGLKAGLHLFEPKHFIMPFLAHALGTFIGALLASIIAASNQLRIALGIGIVFFIGGTIAVYMLPAPLWFNLVDLIFAYIPMAYLAAKIIANKTVK